MIDKKISEVAMGNRSWVSAYSSAPVAETKSTETIEQNNMKKKAAETTETETASTATEAKAKKVKTPKAKKPAKEKKAKAPKQAKASKAKKAAGSDDNSRYDKIMGFSVCAVVRRLGKEGVSFGHAKAILEANGVKEMTDKSLRVQLWFGKNEKKTIAELTKDQVAELKGSAAEPVSEAVAA